MDYLYQNLEKWLLDGIKAERWKSGEKLPSVRALCQQMSTSKSTVLKAYHRLESQGVIESRPKSGYFVLPALVQKEQPYIEHRLSEPSGVTVGGIVADIMSRGAAFDILPSADTELNSDALNILNRSIGRALRKQKSHPHYYYGELKGDPDFRSQIAERYRRAGCSMNPEDLIITSGCQHSLFIALSVCCQPGDLVAIESPGFYGAIQLLEQLGLQIIEIPSSPTSGMNISLLEEALSRWSIKACIVTPAFATPTGSLMPDSNKAYLYELSEHHDFIVIEDDIYGELSFSNRPEPLKALDQNGRVILCGSLSKSLSRDLRTGWIYSERFREKIQQWKLVTQLSSSQFVQEGITDFIATGGYDLHLKKLRNHLRQQRDDLVRHLDQEWPSEIRISIPEGGLSIWVQLPDSVDTLVSYRKILDQGIVITPGAIFTSADQYRSYLRLSFAHPLTEQRQQALHDLKNHLLNGLQVG